MGKSPNVFIDISSEDQNVNNVVTGIVSQALEISGFKNVLLTNTTEDQQDLQEISTASQTFQELVQSAGEDSPDFFPNRPTSESSDDSGEDYDPYDLMIEITCSEPEKSTA